MSKFNKLSILSNESVRILKIRKIDLRLGLFYSNKSKYRQTDYHNDHFGYLVG